MAATVFGTPRYGAIKDVTLTGIEVGTFTASLTTEKAYGKNHLGNDIAKSLYNDKSEITLSGVVALAATGIVPDLADAVALANGTQSENLFTALHANAGFVVESSTLTRSNTEFEEGEVSGVYDPLIPTNAPLVLTD